MAQSDRFDLRNYSWWWVQGAYLIVYSGLVALWFLIVPQIVIIPRDLIGLVQHCPLFSLPLMLVYGFFNAVWFKQIISRWHNFVDGNLDSHQSAILANRTSQYPYHVFVLIWGGMAVIAAAISVVLAFASSLSMVLVLEIFVLVATVGVVQAMLSFLVARSAVILWLQNPNVEASGFRWEPDMRKRVVLGVVATVSVVWEILGVVIFDAYANLDRTLAPALFWRSSLLHTGLFLALGELAFLLLAGLVSWMAVRDLSTDNESIARCLQNLGDDESLGFQEVVPVLSLDERGEFVEAFNRLVSRLSEQNWIQKKIAEEARAADQRQMEFFAVISHDLRTPLHSIVGFSQLMMENSGGTLNPEQQEDVRNILKAGHHLLTLIDDVVDFSKIESGMMELFKSRVDVAQVIDEALQAASGLRHVDTVRLRADFPPNLPPVFADETRLRQILFNLIGNSLKFTSEGEVCVKVTQDSSEELRVEVVDSGPGIAENDLAKVFGEFEQLRATQTSVGQKGTGLGLAITRRLVELHGGKIGVNNRREGGAIFFFTLPVFRPEDRNQ